MATKMKEMLDDEDVSPQTLGLIVTFLKNNNITCDSATEDSMSEMERILKEKKDKRTNKLSESEKSNITELFSQRNE